MPNQKKGLSPEEIKEAAEKAELFMVSQKLVLLDNSKEKILILANPDTGKWELPGGIVDKGEPLEDALLREIREELGDIKYSLTGLGTNYKTNYTLEGKKIPVLLQIYIGIYEDGEITLSNEHTEIKWQTLPDIQSMDETTLSPGTKDIIANTLNSLKKQEYLNDLLRLQADFDNYKKRQTEAEKSLKEYLIQGLVLDIIPVLDNFNAATQHVPEEQKSSPWVVGIQYIEKQLADVLAERGVQALVPTIGEAFDPSKHEAIESETPEGEETQNIISQVKQKGYQLGDRIIRPAKVSIK